MHDEISLPLPPPRALGDHDFKAKNLMSSEPDVTLALLQPHHDHFTILASDGLWGYVTDVEAVDHVHALIAEVSWGGGGPTRDTSLSACANMCLIYMAQRSFIIINSHSLRKACLESMPHRHLIY